MFSINQLLPDSVHLWGKQEEVCNNIYVTNKLNLWSFQGCVGKCLTIGSPEKERERKEAFACFLDVNTLNLVNFEPGGHMAACVLEEKCTVSSPKPVLPAPAPRPDFPIPHS